MAFARRAVGDGLSPVPPYLAAAPFIDAMPTIRLQALSTEAMDDFIVIERPAPPERAAQHNVPGLYGSIGAFYAAIETAIRDLCTPRCPCPSGSCRLSAHRAP